MSTANFLQTLIGHQKTDCCTNERHGSWVDSGKTLGSSKVRNFEHTTVHVDENIVTFDVSMNNLVVMLTNII